MRRFGENSEEFFNQLYEEGAPWIIGRPQSALMELIRKYPPSDPILDVGCASGDLAIAIAAQGYDVVGVDIVEAAIESAKEKARVLPGNVRKNLRFEVGNVMSPDFFGRRYGAIVDSGFYHLLERDETGPYIEGIHRGLVPGGRYYLLGFSVEFDIPNVPRAISEWELREQFSSENGWQIEEVQAAEFQSTIAPTPALAASIVRLK